MPKLKDLRYKLLNTRSILCTIVLILGCHYWAKTTTELQHQDPTGYQLMVASLLYLQPIAVILVTIIVVFIYLMIEYYLGYSKSINRLLFTLIITLVTPFLIVLTYSKLRAPLLGRNIEAIQEARFGEHGKFLKNADRITLYSTNPELLNENEQLLKKELFHSYEVLGKIEINNPEIIQSIYLDLKGRIYSDPGESHAMCFDPRHGIRAHRGDDFIDYLICFGCHHLYIYRTEDGDYERIGLEGPQVNKLLNNMIDKAGLKRDIPPAMGR